MELEWDGKSWTTPDAITFEIMVGAIVSSGLRSDEFTSRLTLGKPPSTLSRKFYPRWNGISAVIDPWTTPWSKTQGVDICWRRRKWY